MCHTVRRKWMCSWEFFLFRHWCKVVMIPPCIQELYIWYKTVFVSGILTFYQASTMFNFTIYRRISGNTMWWLSLNELGWFWKEPLVSTRRFDQYALIVFQSELLCQYIRYSIKGFYMNMTIFRQLTSPTFQLNRTKQLSDLVKVNQNRWSSLSSNNEKRGCPFSAFLRTLERCFMWSANAICL